MRGGPNEGWEPREPREPQIKSIRAGEILFGEEQKINIGRARTSRNQVPEVSQVPTSFRTRLGRFMRLTELGIRLSR